MAKRKPLPSKLVKAPVEAGKKSAKTLKPSNGAPQVTKKVKAGDATPAAAATELATAADGFLTAARFLPVGAELKSLYARYYNCSQFDDHDKAFYFVLDVGGLSRARQLLTHVEEVLAELEEFQG